MSKSAVALGGLALALIVAGFFGLRTFLATEAQEGATPAIDLAQPPTSASPIRPACRIPMP